MDRKKKLRSNIQVKIGNICNNNKEEVINSNNRHYSIGPSADNKELTSKTQQFSSQNDNKNQIPNNTNNDKDYTMLRKTTGNLIRKMHMQANGNFNNQDNQQINMQMNVNVNMNVNLLNDSRKKEDSTSMGRRVQSNQNNHNGHNNPNVYGVGYFDGTDKPDKNGANNNINVNLSIKPKSTNEYTYSSTGHNFYSNMKRTNQEESLQRKFNVDKMNRDRERGNFLYK